MKNNETTPTENTSNYIRTNTDIPSRTKVVEPLPTQEEAKEIMAGVTQKIEKMRKLEKSLDKVVKNNI